MDRGGARRQVPRRIAQIKAKVAMQADITGDIWKCFKGHIEKPLAEWTLERQKLVAAFVDSLKTANANPKALVDAAAKVFKVTKGLDPTVTSLLAATIKVLPPGAQTIVFENVEKIEGKLHSLNVPPTALQLLMATKDAAEQGLAKSNSDSASLEASVEKEPQPPREENYGKGGEWDNSGKEAMKAFVDCLLTGNPKEIKEHYFRDGGLNKVTKEKTSSFRNPVEDLVGKQFDRWIGAALAGKSQDQIAQIKAKVAEQADITGLIWDCFKGHIEIWPWRRKKPN
jgi:hypothetical protein